MKPVVSYTILDFVRVGYGAILKPVNHPSDLVSNQKLVHTSEVISYDECTGKIETKNTIYVRATV